MYTQFRELETALLAVEQIAVEITRNPSIQLPEPESRRIFHLIWEIGSLNRQLNLVKDVLGSWDPVSKDDILDYRHSRS